MARSTEAEAGPSNSNKQVASSQPKTSGSTSSKPQFVDKDGQPIQFFLQWDLNEKLVLRLTKLIERRNGSIVTATPLPPTGLVLVDPLTKLGKQFIKGATDNWNVVSYTYVQVCIDDKRVLDPEGFGHPLPIFNQDGDTKSIHVHETVEENRSDRLKRKIHKHGGRLVDEEEADFIIVDKSKVKAYAKLKKEYGFTQTHLVPETWVQSCIESEEIIIPEAKKRTVGGRRPGEGRTEFSEEDDRHLVAMLAKYYPDPSGKGRSGTAMWTYVLERPDEYPWAQAHVPRSWQNRYSKSQEYYDKKIQRYLMAHSKYNVSDEVAAAKRPWTWKTPGKRKRGDTGDRDSDEEVKRSKKLKMKKDTIFDSESDDPAPVEIYSPPPPSPPTTTRKIKSPAKTKSKKKISSKAASSQETQGLAVPLADSSEDVPLVKQERSGPKPRRKAASTNEDQDDTDPQEKNEEEAEVSADLEIRSADVDGEEINHMMSPIEEQDQLMDLDEDAEEQQVAFETSPLKQQNVEVEESRVEIQESSTPESFPPIRVAPPPEPSTADESTDAFARAFGKKGGRKDDVYTRMVRNKPASKVHDDQVAISEEPSGAVSTENVPLPTPEAVAPPSPSRHTPPAAVRIPRKRTVTSAKSKFQPSQQNSLPTAPAPVISISIPVDPEPEFLIPRSDRVRLSGRTSTATAITTSHTLVSSNTSTAVDRDSLAKLTDDGSVVNHSHEELVAPIAEARIPTPPPPTPPVAMRLRRGRSASVDISAKQPPKKGTERERFVSAATNKRAAVKEKGKGKLKPSKELSTVPDILEEPSAGEVNPVPTNISEVENTRSAGKSSSSRSAISKKLVTKAVNTPAPAPGYPATTVQDMQELMTISSSTGLSLEEVVVLFGECEGNLTITRRIANRMQVKPSQ